MPLLPVVPQRSHNTPISANFYEFQLKKIYKKYMIPISQLK